MPVNPKSELAVLKSNHGGIIQDYYYLSEILEYSTGFTKQRGALDITTDQAVALLQSGIAVDIKNNLLSDLGSYTTVDPFNFISFDLDILDNITRKPCPIDLWGQYKKLIRKSNKIVAVTVSETTMLHPAIFPHVETQSEMDVFVHNGVIPCNNERYDDLVDRFLTDDPDLSIKPVIHEGSLL